MAIAKIQNVTVDSATKKKIRDNSPFALPLNPTVQGWSAQHVRDQLFKAICGSIDDSDLNPDETNLLNVFSRRVSIIKEILEELDNRYVDLTSTVLVTRSAIVSIITEEKVLFLIKPSFTDDVFVASNLYLVFKDTTNLYVLGMRTAIISLTSPYSTVLVTATKSDLNLEIVKIVDGTTTAKKAEQDKEGNVISTHYVSNATLGYGTSNHRIALTLKDGNGSPIVSAIYTELPLATQIADGLMAKEDKVKLEALPTNADLTTALNAKVPSTRKILGIDLDDDVLLGEFKTALGVAITSASGLMSATDKTRLDALHALLGVEADANAVVSTINEVLAIFNAYPEGADLVSALGGKVDKVSGKGLSANDFTDALKSKLDSLLNGSYYYNKEYIDALKDMNGWSSALLTQNALTNGQTIALATLQQYDIIKLFARNTSTNEIDTDSFDISVGLVNNYEYRLFDNANIKFVIGASNCTFTDTVGGYELKIIGQKYVAQQAENVNYDKTVKNLLESDDVQGAIDELAKEVLAVDYEEVTHTSLQSEITATNDIEIKDDSGELVKITGNTPTNLISNGDLLLDDNSDGLPNDFTSNFGNKSLLNGVLTLQATGSLQMLYPTAHATLFNANDYYYTYARVKTSSNTIDLANDTDIISNNEWVFVSTIVKLSTSSSIVRIVDRALSDFQPIEIDYIGAYNVSDMIRQGVKNDNGVLFSALTNEEIKEQLNIWHEVGYPTHINKLISKSDNLFNGKFNTLTSLDSENIMPNGDFSQPNALWTTPTNTETEIITFTDKMTLYSATGVYKSCAISNFLTVGNKYYMGFDSVIRNGRIGTDGLSSSGITADGYNSIVSDASIHTLSIKRGNVELTDFDVDNIKLFDITDLVSRGILPLGLSNAQYKEMIDNAIFDNVPLRESDFISVEPSVAYRLIKASENSAIHKVIEYTTDNQIVKVNSVDYGGNVKISSAITMNALTRKVKLISDLMNRPNKVISNSDFSDSVGWSASNSSNTIVGGNLMNTGNGANATPYAYTTSSKIVNVGMAIYTKARIRVTNSVSNHFKIFWYDFTNAKSYNINNSIYTPSENSWYEFSDISSFTANGSATIRIYHNYADAETANGKVMEVDYVLTYNITEFKDKGVVDDNGTLFSRLTNGEIKDQMDIWTEVGFPDHVINALYPDGADTAISLKYNDGDAIYYPQVIDELPLDITLRSGEYWQDGYIIKQNGNAEASPLGKVFSAWNYGQIEAIYDSGVPADFKVKYSQNISSQVSTHSEYLKEARKTIDTLRNNQEHLIDKLGIDVDSIDYDSYVGITGETFEYYTLDGVKEGNILNVDGLGQSVINLISDDISASVSGVGLTITYDDTTGVFTVNGTTTSAGNIILKAGMDFGLPVGTTCQLMRYFDSGTLNLNGSYVGYVISGTGVSNRINENSESLYDPYINGVGELKTSGANPSVAGTSGQSLLFQVYKAGMVFTDFKFKIALYEGTTLRPFAMPNTANETDVDVYNRTANILDMGTSDIAYTTVSGITIGYNALAQEFVISGTATANASITLKASILDVISGDRVSIKRLFQSGDITALGTLPTIELFDGTSVVLSNSIYKMTAPEGQTPTPDVNFNTATISADGTLTLRLTFKDDDVFDNYRFRLMLHDKSIDIGYVAYNRSLIGSLSIGSNERASFTFNAINYGVLEFIPKTDKLNAIFGDTITDLDKTMLEYNAGIQSPNRKISVLEARMTALDNPFRDKVIAIWGDSRESNNPTSDPQGIGDQKDTSYPALLAKKLGATVLNFGLSGGAWAENTVQQDADSAIVNRVLTEDTSGSADVIIISSMNDFKLATPLGSSATNNKDATTFYGAMRLTYDRLATKYPSKKIWLVLPQKRFDETTNYGGGDYLSYRKAQIDVAKEYGIPTIDLYNNFPNTKPTFFATNMLNDTHFSAVGNDLVAEIIMRSLLGNGNSGVVETLPALPTSNGTYTLKLTVLNGVNTFSWILDN